MRWRIRGARRAQTVTGLIDWVVGPTIGGLACGLVIITVLAWGLVWRAHPAIVRETRTMRELAAAHEAMMDQKLNLTSYELTRGQGFLDRYDEAVADLGSANDRLVSLIDAHDPVVLDAFLDLRLSQHSWHEYARQERRALTESPHDAKDDVLRGTVLFEAYDGTYHELFARIASRRDEVLNTLRAILLFGSGFGLLVWGGVLGHLVVGRRRSRVLVGEPAAALRQTIERLGGGDLSARVPRTALEELDEIGSQLNDLAASLEEERELRARREVEMEQSTHQLYEILSFSKAVAGRLNLRYVQESLLAAIRSVTHGASARVLLLNEEGSALRATATRGDAFERDDEEIEFGVGLAGEAAATARPAMAETGIAAALPMIVGGRVVGVVEMRRTDGMSCNPETLGMLELLSGHAGTAIEAARLHEGTVELGHTDALTRLSNRRRFDQELAEALEAADGASVALVMMDLDHFKEVNDRFGHPKGDEVLEEVGTLLTEHVRDGDAAYRFGGEEFAVIMRGGTTYTAVALAERVRKKIQERFRARASLPAVTASFGVAAVPDVGATATDLIEAADAALYEAKANGRNRTEMPSDATPGPRLGHAASA